MSKRFLIYVFMSIEASVGMYSLYMYLDNLKNIALVFATLLLQ